MNEAMIKEWNDLIEPEDTVYILGDVAFMSGSDAGRTVNRSLQDATFRNAFKEVHKYLDVTYDGHKIVMFHYPISEWDQMHRGSLHFFGHVHGGDSGMEKYRCRDVGMDATGMIAVSMEWAIANVKNNEIKGHH